MSDSIHISWSIYPKECLERAVCDYRPYCTIETSELTEKGCVIYVLPLRPEDEAKVKHSFLKYLLDISLDHHLQR